MHAVGMGAFGTVYKASDPELDRTVAIKVPRAGISTAATMPTASCARSTVWPIYGIRPWQFFLLRGLSRTVLILMPEPVAFALHGNDLGVVQEAVEDGGGPREIAEKLAPILQGTVRGHHNSNQCSWERIFSMTRRSRVSRCKMVISGCPKSNWTIAIGCGM